ncbi:MAG TPA: DNA gyrase modulator, partial [Sporichthya sp.]|nr:DNA gyrase modulator [Sporichthya sp.]
MVNGSSSPGVDDAFLAMPSRSMADAALDRARALGASHADFRLERVRDQAVRLRDSRLEASSDSEDVGFAVRVVVDGTWGFASGIDLTPETAARVAEQAVEVARTCRPVNTEPIELAPEPAYPDATWVSAYDVDPFDVPLRDKVALLSEWSSGMLGAVDHVSASLMQVKEQKFYADTAGTVTTQQRVRVHPALTAMKTDGDRFDDMRTLAPPVGRGYEYLTGTGWDFDAEIA